MPRAFQMPIRTELATRTGPRVWSKTVLKAGHISKGGVELDVDRALLETLASNFKLAAKDQVQFVLADAKNRHNELPERVRGEVLDLAVTDDDRLVATFGVSARGDQLLEENPRLGASVSFVDRFSRADGRDFGPTLLHVAGTLDPEIAGLGDWVRADLSADPTPEVIDLSGAPDAPRTPNMKEDAAMPAPLTDEELTRLRAILDRETAPEQAEQARPADELSDEDLALIADAALNEADDDGGDGGDGQPDPATETAPELAVAASADTGEALNLANARLDAQALELAALRNERDSERYTRERDQLAQEFGIPPRITDLCRRWLTGSRTIQLSSGEQADPGADIRRLLKELGSVTRLLDLSAPLGTAHELPAAVAEKAARDSFIDQARTSGFAR